jgi:Uma2 family endonuclease
VVSPTDTISAMRRKVRQYLEAGARVVWVIDPDACEAQVYTNPTAPPVILTAQDRLECPDLLPGFQVAVGSLFETDPD